MPHTSSTRQDRPAQSPCLPIFSNPQKLETVLNSSEDEAGASAIDAAAKRQTFLREQAS